MQPRELKLQELGRRLVAEEIYCCASMLMSGVAQIMYERSFYDAFSTSEDDIYPLLTRVEYEEAAQQAINDEDDIDTLEMMADEVGYWDDVLQDAGVPDELPEDEFEETMTLATWLNTDAGEGVLGFIKEAICRRIDHSNAEDFCREFDVDTDDYQSEVYEHWVISNWLRCELGARGETVGEFASLTLWGRCCTGQSICLDHVIQQIAAERWPDELTPTPTD